ncbi:hypothetical protein FJW04_21935 [Mesorhizobium sp. B2-7-3]|uniref:hypothetical protein n=1 Tax=unclassified Mesorhizobium TaxID=325217 RepID=UPI00112A712D|nr:MULTISPECIES: hypothetical protein [unclassified Mesorhizobium]MBZ9927761.1 hypothetical protein [Mesorhizobium sp. BR1-1-4]TPJ12920.1 hypothetical protein FJW04_21935 [Mesorhizobium sp. B2-7-3]
MSDKETPERWWAPPAEHVARVEQNRQDFMKQFGDFEAAACDGFWLGSSPDGQYLALQFDRPDGTIERIAIHWQNVDSFFTELAGAIEYVGTRQLANVKPGGSA